MIVSLKSATDSRIEHLLKNPSTIEEFLEGEQGSDYLSLEKAWHGLHFLFTNSPWEGAEPLCYLLCGGQVIGDIDVGYGPARAITSKQVAAFESELEKIDQIELRRRFNPEVMTANDIYPAIWDRPIEEDDTIGYLCDYFTLLKPFVKAASQNTLGMVIWTA